MNYFRQLDPEYHDSTFYTFVNGRASMATDGVWISALYESLEAAKSWVGHEIESEEAFARLNAATGGKGELLLGARLKKRRHRRIMSVKKEDVIREIETMISHGGYQVAKSIVKLAEKPEGTFQQIGKSGKGRKRPMSQAEAKRLVDAAKVRIEAADAPD